MLCKAYGMTVCFQYGMDRDFHLDINHAAELLGCRVPCQSIECSATRVFSPDGRSAGMLSSPQDHYGAPGWVHLIRVTYLLGI